MKKVSLLFLFLGLSFFSYSQNLDSLLTVAKNEKNDSIKIRLLNKVAFSYIFNNSDKAIKIIEEGLVQAEDKVFNYGFTELTNTKGIYMDVTGKSDSASFYFKKALDLSKQYNFENIEVMCTNNLGMFNWNRGNFQEALNYFFESLKMNDKSGEERTRHIYLNNIGLIYQEMLLADKALEYHEKAYNLRVKYEYEKEQAASLNNMGICLKELKRLQEAEQTLKKGLDVAKKSNNLRDYYKILDNLGNVYQLQNRHKEAISTYLKALDVPHDLGTNKKGTLATYTNLIKIYNKLNRPKAALLYSKKGSNILSQFPHYQNDNEEFFLNSAESFYMIDDFETARALTEKFVSVKDSVFSEKNAKAIANLEVKYDTHKKEREILIQRAELAEQDLVIQERNYQLYGLTGFALILGLLGYLFYNQQKLKNQQLQKENQLRDALIKIETQNKLQEQRLQISRDLHDNIGAQLTFIISSIDNLKYGFDIKDDRLSKKLTTISKFTSETIYELRDTIWAMNKDNISIGDLETRIANYIDKAQNITSKTVFEFNIDPNAISTKSFPSVKGMGIYRIIQESIHNSIKYAKASKVNVLISLYKNQVVFEISDNGIGFDIHTVERGYGLNNIAKRARDIQADVQINSKVNQGTKITLRVS